MNKYEKKKDIYAMEQREQNNYPQNVILENFV